MKLQSIAYDLEGTIIDLESVHHQAHIYSAKDAGVQLSLDGCLRELPHFIGGPDEEVAKEIALVANRDGRKVDYRDVHEAKRFHYHHLLEEVDIKPREGFFDFFSAARSLGLKYTVGSLTNEDQAKILLERSGLMKLFGYENIVLREHVKNLKPAPDVWIETAKRASVEPEVQIVFEDSPRGISGAVQIGAYCVGMPTYNRPKIIKELAEAGAKRIFMNWNEINPYHLIGNINKEHS